MEYPQGYPVFLLYVLSQMSNPLFGWLRRRCSPLPIPNREVKPALADDTALVCGKVGRRPFFTESIPKGMLFFLCRCTVFFRGFVFSLYLCPVFFQHRTNDDIQQRQSYYRGFRTWGGADEPASQRARIPMERQCHLLVEF